MRQTRCYFGAAAVGGKLFAVGGVDEKLTFLSSVECYDPSTNEWSFVTPMSGKRPAAAVTADYEADESHAELAEEVASWLRIRGLPAVFDSMAVQQLCSRFGEVVSTLIRTDQEGRSLGEAVVAFEDPKAALHAAQALEGRRVPADMMVDGSTLSCELVRCAQE